MQDKSKLGARYTCYTCGKKFYDLNKPDPVCPSCDANQFDDPTPDPRVAVMARYKGSRMTAQDAAPSKEAFSVEETVEETVDEDANADDTNTAELDEGDDILTAEEPDVAPEPEPEPKG
jgi:uncharacterized protein (TIGR02300 family)